MKKRLPFLETPRVGPLKRKPAERVHDSEEFEEPRQGAELAEQASRCMNCGIPFCHSSCPLGNFIPEWNRLVSQGLYDAAVARLHATTNFPEFTGRLCPAPCEAGCVLSISGEPVTIKQVELALARRIEQAPEDAEEEDVGEPPPSATSHRLSSQPPSQVRRRTTVGIVGSGPAGLACADELAGWGFDVTVLERDDRPGGLLRYGIPDFKMHKSVLDQRLSKMARRGVRFECGVDAGVAVSGDDLLARFDFVGLAVGALAARKLDIPGMDRRGVMEAMRFLTAENRRLAGDDVAPISAAGKHVVILGGGDTGADCLATALRHGAASVTQLELMPMPGATRPENNPWPDWPLVLRTSYALEEGGAREFGLATVAIEGPADVAETLVARPAHRQDDGSFLLDPEERRFPADLVLIAAGFVGPEKSPLYAQLGVAPEEHGRLPGDERGRTANPRVFTMGDARRGASLVVWAIAEGRHAARSIRDAAEGLTGWPRASA
jgi:glutamate synthase (NADPH/NADH) small chain